MSSGTDRHRTVTSRRAKLTIGATTLPAIALALGVGGVASFAGTPMATIPQGISAAVISAATPTGTTSMSTPMTVSFILNPRNLGVLESEVSNGWKGPFLTTQQFAQQYGATPQYIASLESYLGTFGITTSAYADQLAVVANGTAKQFDTALSVLVQNYAMTSPSPRMDGSPTNRTFYGSKDDPSVPETLASGIQSVLGLSNYQPFTSQAIPAIKGLVPSPAQQAAATAPVATPQGSITIPATDNLPSFYVNHYNLAALEAGGATGQGETVGIVTLASVDPSVPRTFWRAIGVPASPSRIQLVNVNGGAGSVTLANGSDETTLDVEQSGAIAPSATIEVYQAPNTDYGFVDAFLQAASDNTASTLSASWGESETYIQASVNSFQESAGYAAAFNEAYLESAAQGQSVFASSGDSGAYDASADLLTTNLSVDSPGDSPYVTAAGGTTLAGQQQYDVTTTTGTVTGSAFVNIPQEMTWNWGYLFPLYADLGLASEQAAVPTLTAGSGGGYSAIFPEPSYQKVTNVSSFSAYEYLQPTSFTITQGIYLPTASNYIPSPPLTAGSTPGARAVPDLSVNADPQTGYAVYDPQFTAAYGSNVELFGGTSFSAPQLNATATVIDSYLGHRVGFWNPAIYQMAASAPGTALTPLDSNQMYGPSYFSATGSATIAPQANFANDNLYYAGRPGAIYNPGSGLGTPNFSLMARMFGLTQEEN